MSPSKRAALMARILGSDTGPEVALRRSLFALGARYRVSYSKVLGRPDIAFPSAKVAVFVHGCFWHGCKMHYNAPKNRSEFWRKKLLSTRARDQRVRETLENQGWLVVEVWEHDVEADPAHVAAEVRRTVVARVVEGLQRRATR